MLFVRVLATILGVDGCSRCCGRGGRVVSFRSANALIPSCCVSPGGVGDCWLGWMKRTRPKN